jgi:hypothetical protein
MASIRVATLVLTLSAVLGPSTLGSQTVDTARVRAAHDVTAASFSWGATQRGTSSH